MIRTRAALKRAIRTAKRKAIINAQRKSLKAGNFPNFKTGDLSNAISKFNDQKRNVEDAFEKSKEKLEDMALDDNQKNFIVDMWKTDVQKEIDNGAYDMALIAVESLLEDLTNWEE